jgi:2-octaprenyl-6-methoxyphenol hydroxylase
VSDRPSSDAPLDALIAGGGAAGHALALALHRGGGGALRIVVADPSPRRDSSPGRAYALAPAGVAFLDRLGVWSGLSDKAQPVTAMRISDSRLQDPVRQTLLRFDAGQGPLAHIVDEGDLTAALADAVAAARIAVFETGVASFDSSLATLAVGLIDGTRLRASLLAAVDGARSPCRALAGLPVVAWDYGQTGLVATVAHERDHGGVAVQHFLPGGPFAILPMTGRRSSIVWTDSSEAAAAIRSLHPDDLLAEIERRFGAQLGAIRLATPLAAFPIRYLMARRLVGARVALVGDAAHVVHPLAGQGLNLGLEDAEALATRILGARRLGLDAGDATALAAYERDRRAANVAMGVATDLLNRLFSNDLTPTRLARDLGLGLVDRMPGLKEFFIRRAAGRADAA